MNEYFYKFMIFFILMLANQNHLYIITELLGSNLFEIYIKPKVRIKKEELRIIVKDILIGLKVLKQFGIIHADLKPENILL